MEITPDDTMCQMIYEMEGTRPEQSLVEGNILGYTVYDLFHSMSGCSTIEECHLKANLMGIRLEGSIVGVVKNFITNDDTLKEYELAKMKILCGRFKPLEHTILPILH